MISIGVEYMGPELRGSRIYSALSAAMKAVIEVRGGLKLGDEPAVNVVFVVPGSLGSCGFDDLRVGTFSDTQQLLLIEAPVPAELVDSGDANEFIVSTLHSAIALAFDFYHRRAFHEFALRNAETLVKEIQRRLGR